MHVSFHPEGGSWWCWAVLGYNLGVERWGRASLECSGGIQTMKVIITIVSVMLPYSWCSSRKFTKCMQINMHGHIYSFCWSFTWSWKVRKRYYMICWYHRDHRYVYLDGYRIWGGEISDLWEEWGHLGGQTKNQCQGTCLWFIYCILKEQAKAGHSYL